MADDHGRQAASCYGSKLVRTPHIDRLGSRGISLRPGDGLQLHLLPFPCHSDHRQVQPPVRRPQARRALRRVATDIPQALATGRLPDRDCRQMASVHRADRVRFLQRVARPRAVLRFAVQGNRPALGCQREPGRRDPQGLCDRRHHRHRAGLAGASGGRQALLPDDSPQGAPFAARSRAAAQGSVQGRRLSRTGQPARRLCGTRSGSGGRPVDLVASVAAVRTPVSTDQGAVHR